VRIRLLLLAAAILLVGLAGPRPRAEQRKSKEKAKAAQTIPVAARVWRSLTTGKEYRVWVENERLNAEWVNIPPALVQGGAYIRSVCRRVGTRWIGTTRSYLPCETQEGGKQVSNWCHLLTKIEIDSVAAERIRGRAEGLRRFDCQRCKILETVWKDFEWVPKEQ
jgi:hypothetical protein